MILARKRATSLQNACVCVYVCACEFEQCNLVARVELLAHRRRSVPFRQEPRGEFRAETALNCKIRGITSLRTFYFKYNLTIADSPPRGILSGAPRGPPRLASSHARLAGGRRERSVNERVPRRSRSVTFVSSSFPSLHVAILILEKRKKRSLPAFTRRSKKRRLRARTRFSVCIVFVESEREIVLKCDCNKIRICINANDLSSRICRCLIRPSNLHVIIRTARSSFGFCRCPLEILSMEQQWRYDGDKIFSEFLPSSAIHRYRINVD